MEYLSVLVKEVVLNKKATVLNSDLLSIESKYTDIFNKLDDIQKKVESNVTADMKHISDDQKDEFDHLNDALKALPKPLEIAGKVVKQVAGKVVSAVTMKVASDKLSDRAKEQKDEQIKLANGSKFAIHKTRLLILNQLHSKIAELQTENNHLAHDRLQVELPPENASEAELIDSMTKFEAIEQRQDALLAEMQQLTKILDHNLKTLDRALTRFVEVEKKYGADWRKYPHEQDEWFLQFYRAATANYFSAKFKSSELYTAKRLQDSEAKMLAHAFEDDIVMIRSAIGNIKKAWSEAKKDAEKEGISKYLAAIDSVFGFTHDSTAEATLSRLTKEQSEQLIKVSRSLIDQILAGAKLDPQLVKQFDLLKAFVDKQAKQLSSERTICELLDMPMTELQEFNEKIEQLVDGLEGKIKPHLLRCIEQQIINPKNIDDKLAEIKKYQEGDADKNQAVEHMLLKAERHYEGCLEKLKGGLDSATLKTIESCIEQHLINPINIDKIWQRIEAKIVENLPKVDAVEIVLEEVVGLKRKSEAEQYFEEVVDYLKRDMDQPTKEKIVRYIEQGFINHDNVDGIFRRVDDLTEEKVKLGFSQNRGYSVSDKCVDKIKAVNEVLSSIGKESQDAQQQAQDEEERHLHDMLF